MRTDKIKRWQLFAHAPRGAAYRYAESFAAGRWWLGRPGFTRVQREKNKLTAAVQAAMLEVAHEAPVS